MLQVLVTFFENGSIFYIYFIQHLIQRVDTYRIPNKQKEENLIKGILNSKHKNKQTFDQVFAEIKKQKIRSTMKLD
jgi:hypothetical protein